MLLDMLCSIVLVHRMCPNVYNGRERERLRILQEVGSLFSLPNLYGLEESIPHESIILLKCKSFEVLCGTSTFALKG
jgi:hypothetical protein